MPTLQARGRKPVPAGTEIARMAQTGLDWLELARAARRSLPKAVTPALLVGWQTAPLLRMAVTDPGAPLVLSEFSRRGRLLWQATTGRW